jgi:hypothetical protein
MAVADIIREEDKLEGKLEGEKDALAFVFELKYGEEGVSFFNLIKDRIISLDDVENIKVLIKKCDNIEELKKELARWDNDVLTVKLFSSNRQIICKFSRKLTSFSYKFRPYL